MKLIRQFMHKYNKTSIVIVTIVIIILIEYFIYLMYKSGVRGQVTFLSSIIGIIVTVFITNHYTNVKLRGSRENDLRNALYLKDHKLIHSTVGYVLNLTITTDKINRLSKNVKNNPKIYKSNKLDYNKSINNCVTKLLDSFNELGCYYLHFLKLRHKSISGPYKKFCQQQADLVNYYDNTFLNNINKKTILLINKKIQRINDSMLSIMSELTAINSNYINKIKKGKL